MADFDRSWSCFLNVKVQHLHITYHIRLYCHIFRVRALAQSVYMCNGMFPIYTGLDFLKFIRVWEFQILLSDVGKEFVMLCECQV